MDLSASVLRTLTPIVVGWALALAAKVGLHLSPDLLTSLLSPVIASLYYVAVRVVEQRVPAAGWLLGKPTVPTHGSAGSETGVPAHAGGTDTVPCDGRLAERRHGPLGRAEHRPEVGV